MKAKDIMSKDVITVSPNVSVQDLAALLVKNSISGVPVIDADRKIVGIVTEKDILYKNADPQYPPVIGILGSLVYLGGVKKYNAQLKKILASTAAGLMTEKVICVHEEDEVKSVVDLMVQNNINRVPVLDREDKLSGIISRADIVRYLAGMP